MNDIHQLGMEFLYVIRDVAPVAGVVLFFQFVVLKRRLPNPGTMMMGFVFVVLGLFIFLVGLDMSVFPVGEEMAEKFSMPQNRSWLTFFAFCVGYSATMAEPALIAVAMKAEEITSGSLPSFYLRNAVAIGVGCGLTLGVYRIVSGGELWVYILCGYLLTIALTWISPREIIPLAYDSGGVTTSTITVPLVTALGLGLARNIPGADPMIDGFGLIAFASVFPVISVLGYAITIKYMNKLWNR